MGNAGKSPFFGLFLLFSILFLTVTFGTIQTASAVTVGILPFEVVINQADDNVYVSNAFGGVFVFDTDGVPLGPPIDVGPGALTGITFDPTTKKVFVANSGTNKVIVIDGDPLSVDFNDVIAEIDLFAFGGIFPVGVEVDTVNDTLYVSNVLSQIVLVFLTTLS